MILKSIFKTEVRSGLYYIPFKGDIYGPNMDRGTQTGHQRSKKWESTKETITALERNRKGNPVTTRAIINLYRRALLSAYLK